MSCRVPSDKNTKAVALQAVYATCTCACMPRITMDHEWPTKLHCHTPMDSVLGAIKKKIIYKKKFLYFKVGKGSEKCPRTDNPSGNLMFDLSRGLCIKVSEACLSSGLRPSPQSISVISMWLVAAMWPYSNEVSSCRRPIVNALLSLYLLFLKIHDKQML